MKIASFIYMVSTSGGAGNLTVAPVAAYRNFATVFGVGTSPENIFEYGLRHQTASPVQYESGEGYMLDSVTLVRLTVRESSNGGAAVNFSSGLVDVLNDVPAQLQDPNTRPPRNVVTSAGPISITATSAIVTAINQTVGAAMTINIDPTVLAPGVIYYVKDEKGDARTNNITIVPAGSATIDDLTTYALTNPNESIGFYSDGTNLWSL